MNSKMSEEAVSLATLKQTIQKRPKWDKRRLAWCIGNICYVGSQGDERVEKWLKEVEVCVEKLQKQLQKVAKDKFCQDCHEHGTIQACHFCLYEILGEEKH